MTDWTVESEMSFILRLIKIPMFTPFFNFVSDSIKGTRREYLVFNLHSDAPSENIQERWNLRKYVGRFSSTSVHSVPHYSCLTYYRCSCCIVWALIWLLEDGVFHVWICQQHKQSMKVCEGLLFVKNTRRNWAVMIQFQTFYITWSDALFFPLCDPRWPLRPQRSAWDWPDLGHSSGIEWEKALSPCAGSVSWHWVVSRVNRPSGVWSLNSSQFRGNATQVCCFMEPVESCRKAYY